VITIRHTRAEGTLIEGSVKGDGVYQILAAQRHGWRYFRSLGQIGLTRSRDKAAKRYAIDQAAQELRAAGFEVAVEIDDAAPGRPFDETEAERNDHAADRASRYAGRSARATARGEAMWEENRGTYEALNGTPILVGHHSENRHRRLLDRLHAKEGRAIGEMKRGEYWAGRAETAESYQSGRENIPATLRRIAKLEARERSLLRDLDGHEKWVNDDGGECIVRDRGYILRKITPGAGARARYEADLAAVRDELAHWRAHVARAQAAGVKVWGAGDFARGDYALFRGTWMEVLRVNRKTLTVPAIIAAPGRRVLAASGTDLSWTDTIHYDEVTGRASADEVLRHLRDGAE
jgi:hypothetical protein